MMNHFHISMLLFYFHHESWSMIFMMFPGPKVENNFKIEIQTRKCSICYDSEYAKRYFGKHQNLTERDDSIFQSKHQQCVSKCHNCEETFPNVKDLNNHLSICITMDCFDSLQQKIASAKEIEFAPSHDFFKKNSGTKKRTQRCPQCGDKMRNNQRSTKAHICENINHCDLCYTQLPAFAFEDHVRACLLKAENKLDEFKSAQSESFNQVRYENQECIDPVSPVEISSYQINSQSSESSLSKGSNSSQQSISSRNCESENSDLDAKRKNVYRAEYTSKKINNVTKKMNRQLEAIVENSLIEQKSILHSEKSSIRTRSQAACLQSSQSSNEQFGDDEKSDFFTKSIRRSKDFKHFATDLKPLLDFYKFCSNSEKRFLCASILPDTLTDENLNYYASLFNAKPKFIRQCHEERLLKLQEGKNYRIESHRSDKDQIMVDAEVKKAIIDKIDAECQIWPARDTNLANGRFSLFTISFFEQFYFIFTRKRNSVITI